MNPPLLVIGNPENRRVQQFVDAARAQDVHPMVLSHQTILENPATLEGLPDTLDLRLESTGENPEVTTLLLQWGWSETSPSLMGDPEDRADPRELFHPAQHHLGLCRYLKALSAATRPGWRWWTPPAEVERLFDKRWTSAHYHARGIPVPPTIEVPASRAELLSTMAERGWNQVVLKASFGSSASCLAVISATKTVTTLRRHQGAWFNSLRLQHLRGAAQDEVFAFLQQQEPHLERFVPKARLDGAFFDCRILVIAGEPRFIVVRQNRHPITNLHLGGWRGDLNNLRQIVPAAAWEQAMQTCRDVARCHDAHHLGLDLLFTPGFRKHQVIEANAFGDLLPRLHLDGLDVYGYELAAWASRA